MAHSFAVILTTLALSLSFSLPQNSHASGKGHKEGYEKGHFVKKMTKDLDLTEEQEAKLQSLYEQSKEGKKSRHQAMKAAHRDLEEALQGTATDEEVRAKFAALQKLQEEVARLRFEKILGIRAVLTPEQRKKLKGVSHKHGFKCRHCDGEKHSSGK